MKEQSDLMLDVSQAHELKMSFRRNGWTNAEIKTLSEKNLLADILQVVKGQAEIRFKEYLIDCRKTPFIPDGLFIVEHRKFDSFKLNPSYTKLDLSRRVKNMSLSGVDMRKYLAKKWVMNANILDFLIDHPNLIPENWKNKVIYFWGTIYGTSNGDIHVSCLDTIHGCPTRVFGIINKTYR